MNRKNFIWTFDDTSLASGLNGAFSLDYHVPGSSMKVDPNNLVGSRIWLVVRSGSANFLYALINPSVIEQYKEGKYKDDFVLRCEPLSSIRFLPRLESTNSWRLPFLGENVVKVCADDEVATLVETVKKNLHTGFSPPARSVIESVPPTRFDDLERAVSDQLAATLKFVSFGDVSISRSLPSSISALGGVTLTILKTTHAKLREEDIVGLLTSLDPLLELLVESAPMSSGYVLKPTLLMPPMVDMTLVELNPDEISPRIFIAKAASAPIDWLDKTSDAERSHEKILKDFVLHLISNGFKVYKTRSFDLLVEKAGARSLWEIKSANGHNSIEQGEKGIMQLLRYSSAFTDGEAANMSFSLLLQDSDQPALHQYLEKMTARVGVELWLYAEKRDWPQRVYRYKG